MDSKNLIKYSVVIPHFNNEAGLARLLESIPAREDLQVLVVDDKSDSSASKTIVESSGLPNIKWFINNRVKSAGTCRNIGLEEACGQYILFADSDDLFVADAFDVIDCFVVDNASCDLFYFNVTSVDNAGKVSVRHLKNRGLVLDFINKKGRWFEEKLRFSHNVPWGKVISKGLVDSAEILFDQTIIANDGVFSLKVGKAAKKIAACDRVVYCVTSSPNSLTGKKDVDKFRVRLEVYVRYYSMLSVADRKKIGASPLPLLYKSLDYGFSELFRSVMFLSRNDVSILRNFKLTRSKVRSIIRM